MEDRLWDISKILISALIATGWASLAYLFNWKSKTEERLMKLETLDANCRRAREENEKCTDETFKEAFKKMDDSHNAIMDELRGVARSIGKLEGQMNGKMDGKV